MKSQKNKKYLNRIYSGDAVKVMRRLPARSVDLIVTSPPYADRRKKQYGGPAPEKYVEWFLPFAKEFKRILKPKGSVILNIKEHANHGERQIYVLELIIEMRKNGWYWIEDYIWHKKNTFPGKWPNRFRDAWEHCLHFTKDRDFSMYQEAVKIPIGDWAAGRLKSLSTNDKKRSESKTDSGFGRQLINWVGKRKVYPTNVLHLPTISANKNHCAVFPESLPTWFIKVFTKKNGVILDPFIGSGTTAIAAVKTERNFVGIDLSKKYCRASRKIVKAVIKAKKASDKKALRVQRAVKKAN